MEVITTPDGCVVIEDETVKRTAGWLDILYHSITAMVGAGVLGLPAAFVHLGWAGGIIFLLFSFWISWHTYKLLVYMHEVPDLDNKAGGGIRRLDRYDQLAEYVLGKRKGKLVLMPFQMAVLVGIAITYTVVGGESLAAFAEAVSPQGQVMGNWAYFLIFGGLQMLLSLLPNFDDIRLVSLLGAVMSMAYCTIAVAMSATVHPTNVNYNPANVQRSTLERCMGIFNAMTTIFFAYGGHNVALEIQATIPIGGKHGNSTVPPMMKGVNWTFLATGLCYFGVSILGFYAFGTDVSDNVLMAFAHGPNHWVVSMANMMVVVHVAAAYQVYTQPVFQLIEARIKLARGIDRVPFPIVIGLRFLYVGLVTFVGIIIPFFGALMGLIGAVAITPTTFLLPPLLWLMYKQPAKWGFDWVSNWFLVWITGILGVLGAIGAMYTIIASWASFRVFAN